MTQGHHKPLTVRERMIDEAVRKIYPWQRRFLLRCPENMPNTIARIRREFNRLQVEAAWFEIVRVF